MLVFTRPLNNPFCPGSTNLISSPKAALIVSVNYTSSGFLPFFASLQACLCHSLAFWISLIHAVSHHEWLADVCLAELESPALSAKSPLFLSVVPYHERGKDIWRLRRTDGLWWVQYIICALAQLGNRWLLSQLGSFEDILPGLLLTKCIPSRWWHGSLES